jgi:hypothetical protein
MQENDPLSHPGHGRRTILVGQPGNPRSTSAVESGGGIGIGIGALLVHLIRTLRRGPSRKESGGKYSKQINRTAAIHGPHPARPTVDEIDSAGTTNTRRIEHVAAALIRAMDSAR